MTCTLSVVCSVLDQLIMILGNCEVQITSEIVRCLETSKSWERCLTGAENKKKCFRNWAKVKRITMFNLSNDGGNINNISCGKDA